MSYADYARGLSYLEGDTVPPSLAELRLARVVLAGLYADWVASGANTHPRARGRYERARDRFRQLRAIVPGDLDTPASPATLEVSGTTPEESERSE